MKTAYYSSSIDKFLATSPHAVLGYLAESHAHDLDPLQRNAWIAQIEILQRELKDFTDGWIAFEFSIPRMGKRVDTVVITQGIIFVLEFKVGTTHYQASATEQVIDYALDLKNFHIGSHHRRIVPVLIATKALRLDHHLSWYDDGVSKPLFTPQSGIAETLRFVIASTQEVLPLDGDQWASSGYKPTPTIVEAAQALYQGHSVKEITRFDAGKKNLSYTNAYLSGIIERAKADKQKCICFVTGVPGAGKTLAGLNLVTDRTKTYEDEHAVFLSGNGPLVDVLREALARDEYQRIKETGAKTTKEASARKVKSFIQNIHHFRDANLTTADAPIEKVAVFDEAQRAWDMDHVSKFMAQKKGVPDFNMSEPEYLISVMDRHKDWCVIVCLIGGGQEINIGEAGLTEWLEALRNRFSYWKVFVSPQFGHKDYYWGKSLEDMLQGLDHETLDALHLGVSIRSYRAEKLSLFVNALIDGDTPTARALYAEIKELYPIYLTRSLVDARSWLRMKARGTERAGLVCSSGAYRLKPEGLNVREKIDATNWFLNSKDDVRSSYYLEDPATEFDIQGLELDWVGICWDADLRYVDGNWDYNRFRGTNWQKVNSEVSKKYLANAYRVLLTRARQGMCIYVPTGDSTDVTRTPATYDGIYQYFERILR